MVIRVIKIASRFCGSQSAAVSCGNRYRAKGVIYFSRANYRFGCTAKHLARSCRFRISTALLAISSSVPTFPPARKTVVGTRGREASVEVPAQSVLDGLYCAHRSTFGRLRVNADERDPRLVHRDLDCGGCGRHRSSRMCSSADDLFSGSQG